MKSKRKKICHIQLLPIMSGVQRSMLGVLSHLDQNNFDIYVIYKEKGDLTKILNDLGIHSIFVPTFVRQINPFFDIVSFIHLIIIFKKEKFDIIHTHSSKTGLLGRIAARLSGVRQIYHTVHGLPFHEFSGQIKTILFSLLEKIGGYCTDKIIFVNNEERELSIRKGLVYRDQAVTIYNGVDLKKINDKGNDQFRKEFRIKWNIREDEFVIGYVGRLWEQKDPDTLLEIIKLCRDLTVRFVIVGDGPYLHKVSEACHANGQVILTGWVDEPMHIYPAIDLLVLPSLWEGLPMTLIEAMAFGKPLVASNIKGNRECVKNGENGFLCTPKNSIEFKEAIKTIYLNKNIYTRMSINSIKLSKKYFNSDINYPVVAQLYQERLI